MSDPNRCQEEVMDGYWMRQCGRKWKVAEEGGRWCATHAPSAVKARREASDARYQEEKRAREERQQAIIRSHPDVIRLVEAARAVTERPMRGTLRPEPIPAWEDSQDWYSARLGDLRAALAPFEETAE